MLPSLEEKNECIEFERVVRLYNRPFRVSLFDKSIESSHKRVVLIIFSSLAKMLENLHWTIANSILCTTKNHHLVRSGDAYYEQRL